MVLRTVFFCSMRKWQIQERPFLHSEFLNITFLCRTLSRLTIPILFFRLDLYPHGHLYVDIYIVSLVFSII